MRDKRQIHSLRARVLRALAARPGSGLNLSELQVALRESEMSKVRREVRAQLRDGLLQRDDRLRYKPTAAGMALLLRMWPVTQLTLDLGGERCA